MKGELVNLNQLKKLNEKGKKEYKLLKEGIGNLPVRKIDSFDPFLPQTRTARRQSARQFDKALPRPRHKLRL